MMEVEVCGIIREVGDEVLAGTRTVGKRLGGAIGSGTRCSGGTVVGPGSNRGLHLSCEFLVVTTNGLTGEVSEEHRSLGVRWLPRAVCESVAGKSATRAAFEVVES